MEYVPHRRFDSLNCYYEASFGQQDSAVGSCIAKNAELNDKFAEMISLRSTIGHMFPYFWSDISGAIASWQSAALIEKSPKKKGNAARIANYRRLGITIKYIGSLLLLAAAIELPSKAAALETEN